MRKKSKFRHIWGYFAYKWPKNKKKMDQKIVAQNYLKKNIFGRKKISKKIQQKIFLAQIFFQLKKTWKNFGNPKFFSNFFRLKIFWLRITQKEFWDENHSCSSAAGAGGATGRVIIRRGQGARGCQHLSPKHISFPCRVPGGALELSSIEVLVNRPPK